MKKGIFKKKILNNLNEKKLTVLFIFFCVFCAFGLALIQSNDVGPDEKMKMDICKFIADYGELPHGGDERVRDPLWGSSYGFTPILPYMLGGVFIKIASIFTQNMHYYYFAARLVSVMCYAVFLIFVTKIGEKLFDKKIYKWFFIILISILPQMVFLGSYINNDSLAMMCIAMIIYGWIIGLENKWTYKNCIFLAISLGLCALSYYNAYGYILTSAIIFLISNFKFKTKFKDIMKKGILIGIIAFIICGWWFIRSAIIYDGDFLGLRTTDEYSEKYAVDEYKNSKRETPINLNESLFYMLVNRHWITITMKSFYIAFGKMSWFVYSAIYYIVWAVWAFEILGYFIQKIFSRKNKKQDLDKNNIEKVFNKNLIESMFFINIGITGFLSVYYSYTSDFQPQGRYIMPMLIPFMYLVTTGIKFWVEKFLKTEKKQIIALISLLTCYSVIFVNCMLFLFVLYIKIYIN